jgi:hypothetical protein
LLIKICKEAKAEDETKLWFDKAPKEYCGQDTVPLELLVLGCLRGLGTGMCLDGTFQYFNRSVACFFHKFCHLYDNRMFNEFCTPSFG